MTPVFILPFLKIFVSIFAPVLSSVQIFPQLLHTFKTKRVRDLSVHTLMLVLFSELVWLLHGVFIGDFTLIASGVISMSFSSLLLGMFLFYR